MSGRKPCYKLFQVSVSQRGGPRNVPSESVWFFETLPKAKSYAAKRVRTMIGRKKAGKKTWTLTTAIRKIATLRDGTPIDPRAPRCRRR